MSKGLTLARLLYEAGHNVIGADFESNGALVCGRVSKSLAKFHTFRSLKSKSASAPASYIQDLLRIVLEEQIDIWVSCSGVASALEDGEAKEIIEARTSCKAIQFDVATTQLLHEKDTFIDYTRSIGLTVPETHTIRSQLEAERALHNALPDRKFIMKPIGMDDSNRGDMTLLPKTTVDETKRHLSKLKISHRSPWILQQFVNGPEFCTHALVVKGQVKAFVACPSAELLMHYRALPPDSRLSQAMLKFTRTFAARQGKDFTGHLSFDFLLSEVGAYDSQSEEAQAEPALYPIECNPRAHTSVVLFSRTPELAKAYVSLCEPANPSNGSVTSEDSSTIVITPLRTDKYYWIGHDLVELFLLPLLSLLTFQRDMSMERFVENLTTFLEHMLIWRDGTFARWDPAPWWWLYHVYWPKQFWNVLRFRKKWSRVNVSTTKIFEC